jgi:hypothetical protein
MLKKPASSVLASLKASTYMKKYASGISLAAALLDDLFEHPPNGGVLAGPHGGRLLLWPAPGFILYRLIRPSAY